MSAGTSDRSEITWHRGLGHDRENWPYPDEPGQWHAKAGGEVIARAEVREGTPPGYWGRYEFTMIGSGQGRQYEDTLAHVKDRVKRWYDDTHPGDDRASTGGTT